MRPLVALLALAGLACIGDAAMTGGVHAGLFHVFPFVVGTSGWAFLGMLLLIAALFAWTAGLTRHASRARDATLFPRESDESRVERRASSGGVVVLGPIPLVWSNDRRMTPWLVGVAVVLGVLVLAWMLWPR